MKRPSSSDTLPWAGLNLRLVRSRDAHISIFDRSFQLGDGVFATTRILGGWPIGWQEHWKRFAAAARFLGLRLPLGRQAALLQVKELIARNRSPEAVLRLHLSRGCGSRGYSPRGARTPLLVMAMFCAPVLNPGELAGVRLGICSHRVNPGDPLVKFKTASRLFNVLARAEADEDGYEDALLLDDRNHVLEATSSNFFWFRGRTLMTPPVHSGILPGTTRARVLKLAATMGIATREQLATLSQVRMGDGAFLTVGTRGILEVRAIAGRPMPVNATTTKLYAALVETWQREARRCAKGPQRGLVRRKLAAP